MGRPSRPDQGLEGRGILVPVHIAFLPASPQILVALPRAVRHHRAGQVRSTPVDKRPAIAELQREQVR